jgi:hypothetical protein
MSDTLAAAAAPATLTSDPGSAAPAAGFLSELATITRKWQTSLTLQGGALGAAATFIAAKGGPLLVALGVPTAVSGELVGDVAAVLGTVSTLMVFVGRLRLGDLK